MVRGALQRGLEGPLISHRQSRRHYGIKYWAKFREGIDPEGNRTWDDFEGTYKCNNLMSWYLKKGEKVADTKAVSLPWYKTRDLNSDLSCEEIDIFCCASDKVPTYKDSGELYLLFILQSSAGADGHRYVPGVQAARGPVEYSEGKVRKEEECDDG